MQVLLNFDVSRRRAALQQLEKDKDGSNSSAAAAAQLLEQARQEEQTLLPLIWQLLSGAKRIAPAEQSQKLGMQLTIALQ